jgi:2-furoyl-CoA dehydrogenase large subunit
LQVSEQRTFPRPRDEIWEKLMDFSVLARTLPGVTRLDPVDGDSCAVTVEPPVSSITGTYEGTVSVIEKSPIDNYALRGEAKGTLGWVKGDALFELTDEDAGTRVASTMSFHTGGVLSGVGQRFMEGVARSMMRQFLNAFERELGAPDGHLGADRNQDEEER